MEDPKAHTPPISVFFAGIAMVPIAFGTVVSLALRSPVITRLTTVWCGAILCFFAGVKRGLSFRQPGGPTVAQLGAMFATFLPGVLALLLPWRAGSILLLLLGYGSEAVLGPIAAEREEAPRFFKQLRPVQMIVPIASLALLLIAERRQADRS